MRSNVLKIRGYIQDNVKPATPPEEPWEIRRARIAAAIEEACRLPDTKHGPDLEEFSTQYDLNKSDFA